jgi:formate dehydrogenase maturation protein FdhE
MTPPNVELAHLYALRVHLDAVILAAETSAGLNVPADPNTCPSCKASGEGMIVDASTLDGTKRRRCTNCNTEWEVEIPA